MAEDNSPQKQDKYKTLIEQTEATRFKEGESGNPGGRPKGKSITAELRKLIDSGTTAEDIAQVLIKLARKENRGQVNALKELLDRTDGKVIDVHKIEGDVPVTINYILKEKKDE